MSGNNFTLEDSNGHIIQNPTEEQIRATINKVGRGIDHCILSTGNTFIQTADSGNGLLVEVNDGSGVKEADKADFSPEEVCTIFIGFLDNDRSWEKYFPSSPATGGSTGNAGRETPTMNQFNVKEEITNALKSEGMYRVKRSIRRGVSLIGALILD